jgi:hypothetical protein
MLDDEYRLAHPLLNAPLVQALSLTSALRA